MAIVTSERMVPPFDPRGWMHWPANEDYSLQFQRLLGAAQDGGSTISECLLAASGIDPACEESWYRQWKKAADLNKSRGDIALARGHVRTALSNWLRAANYYRTAQTFMASDDPRRGQTVAQMMLCSQLYLRHITPAGEVVEIAWGDGAKLQGYFLRPPGHGRRKLPVVLCVSAPDHYKEDYLCRATRYAHERGLALLLVDLPGQEWRRDLVENYGRYDVETAMSDWVDFLVGRADVDADRIAVFGDGLGAPLATRGASFDDRFAAAVCDAGIWELHERAFLTSLMSGDATCREGADEDIGQLCRRGVAPLIRCPVLVAMGERDWLQADRVRICCDALAAAGRDIDLKIFSAVETAAAPSQQDNPTIGNEFIFDWIADHLDMRGSPKASRRLR